MGFNSAFKRLSVFKFYNKRLQTEMESKARSVCVCVCVKASRIWNALIFFELQELQYLLDHDLWDVTHYNLWNKRFCSEDGTKVSFKSFVPIYQMTRRRILEDLKTGNTLSSRHVSSCDVKACSLDVRGDFNTEFYGADSHFCDCSYVSWSRVELWSAHVPASLSNFCCRTHFVRRDVRVVRSSDVTSCIQKWRKCLLKKCANGPFYMILSYQIIEISIWEPTHGKG
jgi:hypothetical protein